MNFPHHGYARPASKERQDHKALLASAIARQAAGWTARAMMMSEHQARQTFTDDVIVQRIHYFSSHQSGRSSLSLLGDEPFGAFFPRLDPSIAGNAKGKRDINQYSSTLGKVEGLKMTTVELETERAGLGILRTL